MKTKLFVTVALALQVCFLILFLLNAPEVDGGIKVGLQRLTEKASPEAPSIQTRTDGAIELMTAGDYFNAAGNLYRITSRITAGVSLASVIILTIGLFAGREKTKAVTAPQK